MIDEDDAKVFFSHGETLVMIGHLTNAVLSLNSAVALVADGKQMQASSHLVNSGEQVGGAATMTWWRCSSRIPPSG